MVNKMEYRNFEKLGFHTSLLGFGCMRFPLDKDGNIDEARSMEMLETAYQNGVNYYDTAYVYHGGKSEEFTGRFLNKKDRRTYYLATKLPIWDVNSLADAKRIFEEQLSRLDHSYIDFYLLHSFNRGGFDRMVSLGILEYMDQLKAEGKIRYLGFSFHDDYDTFEYIIRFRDWDFCQIQLNYMDTELQAGIKGYHLTADLGVPVIVMEPVKGGSIAKLPPDAVPVFDAIHPGKTPASWAIRWVASLPNVKVILSGMSDLDQVQDNLDTLNYFLPLNKTEYSAIETVADILRHRVKNGCTGCSYCMPCPAGVDIPRSFSLWNDYGRYENRGEMKWQWTFNFDEAKKAKNCIECGQCEESCPQKLSIRNDLKILQLEFDEIVKTT
jgi:predicted aldo/keto reductase-like oxidoreductase